MRHLWFHFVSLVRFCWFRFDALGLEQLGWIGLGGVMVASAGWDCIGSGVVGWIQSACDENFGFGSEQIGWIVLDQTGSGRDGADRDALHGKESDGIGAGPVASGPVRIDRR